MKICPECGKKYDDSWEICLNDSLPLKTFDSDDPEMTHFVSPVRNLEEESLTGMSNAVGSLMMFFTPLFTILNIFAGIVGGVWLLFMGEWKLVLGLFIFSMLFPLGYSIFGFFTMGMAWLLAHLEERKKSRWILLSIGGLTITITNLVHLFLILIMASVMHEMSGTRNSMPFLLYGYAIILSPFQYMASREPSDALGTWLGTFLLQLAYVIFAITFSFGIGFWGLLMVVTLTFFLEIFQIKFCNYALKHKSELF